MTTQEEVWLLKEKYNGQKTPEFFADVDRLALGEPLAYLIGHIPFLDISVDLSTRPLIPRPETEFWTEKSLIHLSRTRVLDRWMVLELFSGSGAIGVSILKKFPKAHVDFADINTSYFESTKKTLEKNGIGASRAAFFESDVWKNIPEHSVYDAVFANPPYLSAARKEKIAESVLSFEPHRALFAENDGMELITETISGAPRFLKEGGYLFIEHDDWQCDPVRTLFEKAGFSSVITENDQYNLQRMTYGRCRKNPSD